MFETVSPEVFIRHNRPVFYETLPVSIGLHLAVVSAFFFSAFMHIAFPSEAPHLAFAYQIALDPPPPPPPPPPPRAAQPVPVVKAAELPPDQIVAPTVIPDTIPVVEAPVVTTDLAAVAPPDAAPAGADGGVVGGTPDGVKGGVVGGEPRGVLGGVLLEDGRVHFKRDMPLPMYVEHQEYPEFPETARVRGWEDSVLVHYVIDTKGRVKELVILSHAEHKEFDDAAVKAIRGWRFRPLMVDGEAKEAVHELTVFFKLR